MTLAEAARRAARTNKRVDCTIVEGGLGNGRSERSLVVYTYIISGHVTVEQGTTADPVFVTPEQAEAVTVEIELDAR